MDNDNGDVDDLGSGWFEVKKKHRSSSKYTLQRSSGGSSHTIPNLPSRSRANCNSDSSRWHDKLQHPPLSLNANAGVDESGSGETTNVHGLYAEDEQEQIEQGVKSLLGTAKSILVDQTTRHINQFLLEDSNKAAPEAEE